MSIKVSEKVANFKGEAFLPNGDIGTFDTTPIKGKWTVVFFWPLDFTFVCPTEIKGFAKHYDAFRKAGAEVVGISTDSVYSHKAWVAHGLGKVPFPLIGDTNHQISRQFGVLLEDKGITLRGTFIIDPKGILKSAVVNDLSSGRSVEETLRTLQAFQTGELTGCEWKPGQAPLRV